MGSPGGGLVLTFLVLVITLFCSISITVAASRCTWAFARDKAIPVSWLWSKVDSRHGTPIWALVLTTAIQMLLGLINLGSSSAFLAFVSVGVISLAVSYGIPIAISMGNWRQDVNGARWTMGKTLGWVVNVVALLWIVFETVLFSMPTVLPVTDASMNYAIVVFLAFMVISAVWYAVYARKGESCPWPGSDDCSALLTTVLSSISRAAGVGWPDHLNLMLGIMQSCWAWSSPGKGRLKIQTPLIWSIRRLQGFSRLRPFFLLIQVIHVLSGPRALLPQHPPMPAENERNRNQPKREDREERACPLISQLGEQTMREEWKCCPEEISNEPNTSQR